MKSFYLLAAVALALTACGDDNEDGSANGPNAETSANVATGDAGNNGNTDADSPPPNNTQADAGDETDASTADEPPEFLAEGTARQTPVILPSDYDSAGSHPLVILLHGYTGTGATQELYFKLTSVQDEYSFVFLRPDGTVDNFGNQFWNATEFCCDFGNTMVDDEGYIVDLIAEAKENLAIDPSRVYLVGHSNGGFMSYRMACNHGDKIAGIVSLAGANFTDPDRCDSETPVAIAQAHGTADSTIAYAGAPQYPSSLESVQPWATRNGCSGELEATGEEEDLDTVAAGAETTIEAYSDCSSDFAVERWTMTGSGHLPGLSEDWPTSVLEFLYRHSRP